MALWYCNTFCFIYIYKSDWHCLKKKPYINSYRNSASTVKQSTGYPFVDPKPSLHSKRSVRFILFVLHHIRIY